MKYIFYIVLLFCSLSNAQYYHAKNQTETTEEREIFDAFIVTPANAANLQTELDNRGTVRIIDGDYSATGDITMSTGQKLFGWHSYTEIGGSITIESGSNGVVIKNIEADFIEFESGAEISGCRLKTIFETQIRTTGGQIVDCEFIDMFRSRVLWDCSTSGYFRNNLFIKMMAQNAFPQAEFKGNDTDPSYGNVEIWRNILFSNEDGIFLEDLKDHTIVGIDMETWNSQDGGTLGGIYARNVGDLKLGTVLGYNGGSYNTTPALDIEADKLTLFGTTIRRENASNPSILKEGSDLVSYYARNTMPDSETAASSFTLDMVNQVDGDFLVNGVDTGTAFAGGDIFKAKELLSNFKGTRIKTDRNEYVKLPTGTNWEAQRVGKTDQSASIQALIDANGIAELDEGIYYISQPLEIQKGEGIVGKGVGKTAIVGITDDFPLIECIGDTSAGSITFVNLTLKAMTLQGGDAGLYVSHSGANVFQLTFCAFENLVFADMQYGIHFDQFYGVDNNYWENLTFLRNQIGVFQDPDPSYQVGTDTDTMMYIDKTVFNDCKFIQCGTGLYFGDGRVNNTNLFLGCLFSGNGVNHRTNRSLNTYFVDTTFENTTGSYVLEGGNFDVLSLYGCTIKNNPSVTGIFDHVRIALEDCDIQDDKPIMSSGGSRKFVATNSYLPDNLGDVDEGVLKDCDVDGNSSLSKKLVLIDGNVPTTMVDELADPYPMFLTNKKGISFTETETVFDFTSGSQGVLVSGMELNTGAPVPLPFPTSFSALPDGAVAGEISRRNTNSPSSTNLVGPQTVSNFYAYTEGSAASDNSVAECFRYCMLLPSNYDRDNGLSVSAKVSIIQYIVFDAKISMYYRPVGGDENDWKLATTSPSSQGGSTFVWQNWEESFAIGQGEPVEILFSFYSNTPLSTWATKAYFDNGIDDIIITETTEN